MDTKKWSEHRVANPALRFITAETAARRDLPVTAGAPTLGAVIYHITVGGTEMVPVIMAVQSPSQRRAEQLALAWTRVKWARDRRSLCVTDTEVVD